MDVALHWAVLQGLVYAHDYEANVLVFELVLGNFPISKTAS